MNDHCKNESDNTQTTSTVIESDDATPTQAPTKHTMYVLVRTDIALHHQMVQAAHAAAEAGRRFYRDGHGIASLIVLSVPDKAALFKARDRLAKKGIATEMFFEPDFGIGESALGTQPLTNEQRKHLMGFPLWRAPQAQPAEILVAHPQGSGGESGASKSASQAGASHERARPLANHLSRRAAAALAA